ncbi:hypothetical protein ACQZM9_08120 [Streptomyces sp. P11-1]|uniref:hypothetical protein n=1 Tax=Streptomyces sp. P11-1 TaxID=3423221 RepID=UPI003D2F06E5
MQGPLQRLYRTQLALLATIVTVLGLALMLAAHLAAGAGAAWLDGFPLTDVGSALFTTGLIAIFFEYLNQTDAEERANERLRRTLKEEAPAIRDAVVDGFAFAPDALTEVASDKTLDRIVENCLAIRLGDAQLASDVYRDLRQQVIGDHPRWHDARVSVALAPWPGEPQQGHGSMFVATVRWEYRTKLTTSVMRFSCVSDLDQFRELSSDPTSTTAWFFEPINELTASSPEVFELVNLSVEGETKPVRRSTRRGGQTYSAQLGDVNPENEVTVSYTFRVLVQQHGHVLHLDLAQPTENFTAELWYGDCGIRHVSALDYLSGPRKPRYSRLEASAPTPHLEVAYDGWTLPKGGVAFVWVLEREVEPIAAAE